MKIDPPSEIAVEVNSLAFQKEFLFCFFLWNLDYLILILFKHHEMYFYLTS